MLLESRIKVAKALGWSVHHYSDGYGICTVGGYSAIEKCDFETEEAAWAALPDPDDMWGIEVAAINDEFDNELERWAVRWERLGRFMANVAQASK